MQFPRTITITLLSAAALTVGIVALSDTTKVTAAASTPPTPVLAAAVPESNPELNIYARLAQRLMPSVVNIQTTARSRGPEMYGAPDEFFRHFFGEFPRPERRPRGEGPQQPMALGSGFVIDSSGIILTNNHVVQGADKIQVLFTEDPGEKPTDGEVIGRDPGLDIALIRVKTSKPLVAAALGDSDRVMVGEYVMAVGNPFGRGHSVTHGIISAKERSLPDSLPQFLQTDAPINPGNSGGPLVNMNGEVIGINTAIDARAQGMGFAIPSNSVKTVLDELQRKGTVSRGYLGLSVAPLTPEVASHLNLSADTRGALVQSVSESGPSFSAGIRPYDLITEFNGKPIRNPNDLVTAVSLQSAGSSAKIRLLREGKARDISVKLRDRQELARNDYRS